MPARQKRVQSASAPSSVDQPRFCCSGCAYVYRAIQQLGLSDFYRYRDSTDGIRPNMPIASAKAFAYLDEPEILLRSTDAISPTLHRVVFLLEGIHCAGCVWILEKLNRANPGIQSSRLDFSSGELEVRFDPQQIRLSTIAWLLQRLGYRGVPVTRDSAPHAERKADRQSLAQIAVAGFCAANTMLLAVALIQGLFTGIDPLFAAYFRWVSLLLTLPAVCYSAQPFYRASWGALRSGHVHLDLPLSLAILAGFAVSVWNTAIGAEYVYYDSVTALIFFLLIGRHIQRTATHRALRDSRSAWDLLPMMVERRNADGSQETVSTSTLQAGDTVVVRAGDRIPVDGVVTTGSSGIDASILTGESTPIEVVPGSVVQAGTLNISAELELRVESIGSQTRMGRLLEEVKRRGRTRAPIIEFTNRVSGYFIAGVLLLAALTFVIWLPQGLGIALENSLALLIVTCPCALGIATPVAMSVARGKAARAGLLIKGEDVIERLAQTEVIFLDKTGTVTEGVLAVTEAYPLDTIDRPWSEGRRIELATVIVKISAAAAPHPVREALRRWADDVLECDPSAAADRGPMTIVNVIGRGVMAEDAYGVHYQLGSVRWLAELGIEFSEQVLKLHEQLAAKGLSLVLFVAENRPCALFALLDQPRSDAAAAIKQLHQLGKEVHLLSGDLQAIVQTVGATLGIPATRCHGGRFPEDKERLVREEGRFKAVVGDGINDTAAMTVADVAVGLRGEAEVLTEVSDVVVTRGAIGAVAGAFYGAHRAMALVRRNLVLSLVYNVIGAVLAVAGLVNPLVAALMMPISSLTVISLAACSRTFEAPNRIAERINK